MIRRIPLSVIAALTLTIATALLIFAAVWAIDAFGLANALLQTVAPGYIAPALFA
mgnify:CR=1 FL=1